MSLEAAIAELNTNISSLIAALSITSANQERLIAGQVAAIEKVQPEKKTRASSKKTDTAAEEPAAGNAEPAATASGADAVASASEPRVIDEAALKATANGWLTENADKAVVEAKTAFIKGIMGHLKTPKFAGPESTLDDLGRKKAWFFVERKKAGLDVDFGADYDFDGDPDQSVEGGASDDLGL